jgi:hypothetical protein
LFMAFVKGGAGIAAITNGPRRILAARVMV